MGNIRLDVCDGARTDDVADAWAVRQVLAARSGVNSSLVEVLAGLADRVARLLDGGCVFVETGPQKTTSGRTVPAAAHAHHTDELHRYLRVDPIGFARGLTRQVERSRESLVMPEVTSHLMLLWSSAAWRPYLAKFEVRSIVAAPLMRGRVVAGTMLVWREDASEGFDDFDVGYVECLARHISRLLLPVHGQRVRPQRVGTRLSASRADGASGSGCSSEGSCSAAFSSAGASATAGSASG
jgi:GAF domain